MKKSIHQITLLSGLLLGTAISASAVPVTFQVDMSVQISMGYFTPGGLVEARGSFQAPTGWTGGFTLTNDPAAANPAVYSGTYDIVNTPTGNTVEYKFVMNGGDYENMAGNRTFSMPAAAMTLPVVYYNNLAVAPPKVDVTFQVDMSVQLTNGSGFTAGMTVEARGAFQSPTGWTGGFTLTNDPAAVNPNVYSGTYTIANTPTGNTVEYKFFATVPGWESIGNRSFVMPASPMTLPVTYFNNILPNATKIPVTFQVDMAVQILIGAFDPSADTVQARGGFQSPVQWTSGFTLTNDPVKTNLYVGVYEVAQTPGIVLGYKFVFVKAGDPVGSWAHQDTSDRFFTLAASAQTLPVVFFDNNSAINDYLREDTAVTFNVSMTNAVLYPSGTPYDAATMQGVYVNGDFLGWWTWTAVPSSIAAYKLTNDPAANQIYSTTLVVPRGTNRKLTYKYGVDNYPTPATLDDEMGFGTNHVRYIRSEAAYAMPLDTFGVPVTEPEIGAMTIGRATAGRVLISWSGWPGIRLQTTASVTPPVTWHDVPGTDGLSSTNYPVGSSAAYFRAIKP